MIIEKLKAVLPRFRKLAAATLGGVTGVGVAQVLDTIGWHVSSPVAAAIALLLASVATGFGPANEPKPSTAIE